MERIAILEEENSQSNSRIAHLEEENAQANVVLNEARETINILTELLKEKDDSTDFIDLNEDWDVLHQKPLTLKWLSLTRQK